MNVETMLDENFENTYCGYKFSWLLFMDILGTTNIINSSEKIEIESFEHMIDLFLLNNNQFCIETGNKHTSANFEIINFSDHLVISFPVESEMLENQDMSKEMIERILAIGLINKAASIYGMALERGLLIRGALVRGDLLHKKNKIFGPALLKAINLEKKSFYPRIIVSEEVAKFFENIKSLTPINRDFDKSPYIGCLKSSIVMCNHPDRSKNVVNLFKKFQAQILKNINLNNIKCNDGHFEKWKWIAAEFDESLDHQIRMAPLSRNSLHGIDRFNITKAALKTRLP